MKTLEQVYYSEILPQVRKQELELIKENKQEAKEARIRFLCEEIERLTEKNNQVLDQVRNKNVTFWLAEVIKEMSEQIIIGLNELMQMYKIKKGLNYYARKKKIKSLLNELIALENNEKKDFDVLDIMRARQYSIIKLVGELKNNKMICPWHNDHDPSLHIYQESNSCYCFVCGHHGDVIDLAMKLWHLNFVETVKSLA